MTTDDLIRELKKHPGNEVLVSSDPEGNSVHPLVEVTADFDGYVTLWPSDEEVEDDEDDEDDEDEED